MSFPPPAPIRPIHSPSPGWNWFVKQEHSRTVVTMEKLDVLHIAYPLCQGLQFHSVAGKKVLGMASANEVGGGGGGGKGHKS